MPCASCRLQPLLVPGSCGTWWGGAALFCLQQVGFLPGFPPVSGGPPFPLVLLSPREGFALVGAPLFSFLHMLCLSVWLLSLLISFSVTFGAIFSLFWSLPPLPSCFGLNLLLPTPQPHGHAACQAPDLASIPTGQG